MAAEAGRDRLKENIIMTAAIIAIAIVVAFDILASLRDVPAASLPG
jgi:hypothetical protein